MFKTNTHLSRTFLGSLLCASALSAGTAFADSHPVLTIENFIGTVDIVTKGEDITVTGQETGTVAQDKNVTTIDGGQSYKSSNCKSSGGTISLSFGKKSWFKHVGGYKNLDEYPSLKISVPEGTDLIVRNSVVFGTGEDFASVDAKIASCGTFKVGDINGPLDLRVSGSGNFYAGTVGAADIRISGSGDVELGDIHEVTVIKVSGSGDLDAGNITGDTKITTTGSGDVELGTIDGDLIYEGRGSSDLDAEAVNGRLSITVTGSGDVEIDDGLVTELMITATGASEIDFGGTAGDVTISASGASTVEIGHVTGEREIHASHASDVEINGKNYDD